MIYTETGNGADNQARPLLCSHIHLVKLNSFFTHYIYDYNHQYNFINHGA